MNTLRPLNRFWLYHFGIMVDQRSVDTIKWMIRIILGVITFIGVFTWAFIEAPED